MGQLKNLRHLDLRGNRLTKIPDWLEELPNLEKVDFRWNKLREMTPLPFHSSKGQVIVYL
jgi:Leucine-rich repeat (LRR) protein